MSKAANEIKTALAAPFPACEVEWRIQHVIKDKLRGLAVPYVQSRAIQSRLDDVVGAYNWKAEYKPWHNVGNSASQLCGLAIYCEERGEWIQKWDGAENTDIEPVKGGISDSFKRAAVQWGVGRYLYGLAATWVKVEERGKTYIIPDEEQKRLDSVYEKAVNAPPSNVSRLPAPAPAQTVAAPPFEYAVRAVEQRQFASGNGMVLRLISADGKKNVEAFLQRADDSIAEGVFLKNVKLTLHNNGSYKCSIMESYEVA